MCAQARVSFMMKSVFCCRVNPFRRLENQRVVIGYWFNTRVWKVAQVGFIPLW
jgi:hypothetical protein